MIDSFCKMAACKQRYVIYKMQLHNLHMSYVKNEQYYRVTFRNFYSMLNLGLQKMALQNASAWGHKNAPLQLHHTKNI